MIRRRTAPGRETDEWELLASALEILKLKE
jgi:hypothetical protein